jgi:hypothetical protein
MASTVARAKSRVVHSRREQEAIIEDGSGEKTPTLPEAPLMAMHPPLEKMIMMKRMSELAELMSSVSVNKEKKVSLRDELLSRIQIFQLIYITFSGSPPRHGPVLVRPPLR